MPSDTQLYISFIVLTLLYRVRTSPFLLIHLKRDLLFIGTPQQRAKLTSTSVSFCGTARTPSDSCRNLGVVFDCDISLKNIFLMFVALFYHIRQLTSDPFLFRY